VNDVVVNLLSDESSDTAVTNGCSDTTSHSTAAVCDNGAVSDNSTLSTYDAEVNVALSDGKLTDAEGFTVQELNISLIY